MPEIKIKHVVSFSSEDKVHKAENLVKPETYRKWKCATPGEKSATVVLQFEKATQINSIDIGNESSAFVEVLVGRSSDTTNNFNVLLVASSFMSPLESRNGTHTNRVRMFGPEKLSQSTIAEKWDCVQVVCTQPFNKTITYGLSFIKFHSPGEKIEEQPKTSRAETTTAKMGAFKLKYLDDDDEDESLTSGSWFEKQKKQDFQSSSSSADLLSAPSYASVVLASSSDADSSQNGSQKRKAEEIKKSSDDPPSKRPVINTLNKDHIVYKDVLRDIPKDKKVVETSENSKRNMPSSKLLEGKTSIATPSSKEVTNKRQSNQNRDVRTNKTANTQVTNAAPKNKPAVNLNQKVPFERIMDKVVFVLSGFVNPLRSELRDKALEMGAKYKADWNSSCTHLVCAFLNTPKYEQVNRLKGRIVTKEWILDCYDKKRHIPWTRYVLGIYSADNDSAEDSGSNYSAEESSGSTTSEFDDDDEEYGDKKKKPRTIFDRKRAKNKEKVSNQGKNPPKKNHLQSPKNANRQQNSSNESILNTVANETPSGSSKPSTSKHDVSDCSLSPTLLAMQDESETEDEEALKDYLANTDVESDSGGDTEDEIRKIEQKLQMNGSSPSKDVRNKNENTEKPDVTNLPLPELPNLFKQKHFFLFGSFSSSKQHDMERYIIAYNGIIDDYMNDKIKYVITELKWDNRFEEALDANEDLIFVKPTWIYKCHDAGKLVPYQPYIVIPDS